MKPFAMLDHCWLACDGGFFAGAEGCGDWPHPATATNNTPATTLIILHDKDMTPPQFFELLLFDQHCQLRIVLWKARLMAESRKCRRVRARADALQRVAAAQKI